MPPRGSHPTEDQHSWSLWLYFIHNLFKTGLFFEFFKWKDVIWSVFTGSKDFPIIWKLLVTFLLWHHPLANYYIYFTTASDHSLVFFTVSFSASQSCELQTRRASYRSSDPQDLHVLPLPGFHTVIQRGQQVWQGLETSWETERQVQCVCSVCQMVTTVPVVCLYSGFLHQRSSLCWFLMKTIR